jgi:hypothetical protein
MKVKIVVSGNTDLFALLKIDRLKDELISEGIEVRLFEEGTAISTGLISLYAQDSVKRLEERKCDES